MRVRSTEEGGAAERNPEERVVTVETLRRRGFAGMACSKVFKILEIGIQYYEAEDMEEI